MDYSDILQDISVDLSFMVKKHLKNIKKLDSKQQKQFGKLFGDMKQGIDDLSEGTYESVNEIKKGSIVMPYAMDKHGEFIVDKVFKNKDGETSYIGKFKKSGETREFILHSKDKIVKESVNEAKIAFVNDKLVGDRIQKSGLLPLLGDNNVSLNPNKVKFTRELRDTLVKLYKKYSSLTIK